MNYWCLGDPPVDRPIKGFGGVEDASLQGPRVTTRADADPGGMNEGETGRPSRRLLQAPGFVAVVTTSDSISNSGGDMYRIIPLVGHPALGPAIRQYLGDARGHWDGNTLVIETTNLNEPDLMINTLGYTSYPGTGETLRIIERYTRVNADRMEYGTPSTTLKPIPGRTRCLKSSRGRIASRWRQACITRTIRICRRSSPPVEPMRRPP